MSWKAFFFIILLLAGGAFFYVKLQAKGSPDSQFNQSTRYTIGQYPVLRSLFGFHKPGDARAEYFKAAGPIYIVWFKPDTLDVDVSPLNAFASLVSKYTGRTAQVVDGGSVSDSTVPLTTLNAARIGSDTRVPGGGSKFYVYFLQDYSPRADQEMSTTYLESGTAISVSAYMDFLRSEPQQLNNYILSSLLQNFGIQIGLKTQSTDNSCVMDTQIGQNGQPFEAFGLYISQDFCPAEQLKISQLKSQY
ncbi:MAG: hypothetical protein P4L74_01610 [Candidatus Doudnabacteria bacterium]|nr:hypothetical protein [Candidatus Doudnabacteria bacterium]